MIINADDFGKSKTVNAAIVDSFKMHLIDRTTIMVNMPFFKEAVNLAFNNGFQDKIGLHINLTEGEPVLEETKQSLLCKNGDFSRELLKDKYHLCCSKKLKKIIKNEVEAQITLYLNSGFSLMHIDSHMHVHERKAIYRCIKPLLKKYKFTSVRIRRNVFSNRKKSILGSIYSSMFNKFTLPYKIEGARFFQTKYLCSLLDLKNGFKKSNTEVMVHPDYIDNVLMDVTNDLSMFELKGE